MAKGIKVSMEQQIKNLNKWRELVKQFDQELDDLIKNPPEDLTEHAKAWRAMHKKYNVLTEYDQEHKCPEIAPCKGIDGDDYKTRYLRENCGTYTCRENCSRALWNYVHNDLFDRYIDAEQEAGKKAMLAILEELNLPYYSGNLALSKADAEEAYSKTVICKETGKPVWLMLAWYWVGFPVIALAKTKKDGTVPKYPAYKKLFTQGKVYSGTASYEKIKQLILDNVSFA